MRKLVEGMKEIGPEERISLRIVIAGGLVLNWSMTYQSAQNMMREYRKFEIFKYSPPHKHEELQKNLGLPFVNYFAKRTETDPDGEFKEDLEFIIDFQYVLALYIENIPEEIADKSGDEERRLQIEAIKVQKEYLELASKQLKDQGRGDDWREKEGG